MYKFNDPTTDAEHDFIISKFCELCEIVFLGDYDPRSREELQGLFLHYTSEHFQREEELMRGAGYPQLEQHRVAHAYMQDAFSRVLRATSQGNPNLRADLDLLRRMFLHHILTFDEAYGEWLAGDSAPPRKRRTRIVNSRIRLAGRIRMGPREGPRP